MTATTLVVIITFLISVTNLFFTMAIFVSGDEKCKHSST